MDMMPGFKQTEVGVIPEDWDAKPIGEMLTFKNGLNKAKQYFGFGTPIVNYMDVFRWPGLMSSELEGRVDVSKQELNAFQVRKGDVFFTRTSETVEEIGISSVILDDSTDTVFSGFILRGRPTGECLDDQFKKYCFSSEPVRKQITSKSTYTTRALTNGRVLSDVVMPVPPLAEQRAIAAALSDADFLIESLEQLIAKKRHLKQSAMQELLTGRRRLTGFAKGILGYRNTEIGVLPEDWDCVLLPELTTQTPNSIKIGPFGSALKKAHLTKKGYKVYGQENLFNRDMNIGERFINEDHFKQLKSCEIKPEDILISMMGTVGKCLLVPPNIEAGIMDSHLLRLRLDPLKLNAEFLSHLFQVRTIIDQVKQLSVGGIMEGLSSKIIKSLKFPKPSIEEQTAIAAILSDIDTEIAALESKLAKARQIKQGMMHNLLTGRIRMV